MFSFLTPELSLYAVTEDQVSHFKGLAEEHRYLAMLMVQDDKLNLFSWRLAMDIYLKLDDRDDKLVYLLDRGMVSPLLDYIQRALFNHAGYALVTKRKLTDLDRFIYAVYLSNTLVNWAFKILQNDSRIADNFHITSDLITVLKSPKLNIDELPQGIIELQATMMGILKDHTLENDSLSPLIDEVLEEINELRYALETKLEVKLGWNKKQ